MRIYIAGCFESRPRLAAMRVEVEKLGHKVTSSWLDEPDQVGPVCLYSPGKGLAYAQRDYREILESELLLLDTLDTNERGGREVEFGIAVAFGLAVWVVGPYRNVFHYFAEEQASSWEEALDRLRV